MAAEGLLTPGKPLPNRPGVEREHPTDPRARRAATVGVHVVLNTVCMYIQDRVEKTTWVVGGPLRMREADDDAQSR